MSEVSEVMSETDNPIIEQPALPSRDELFQRAHELRAQGLSFATIARKMDISRETVRRWLKGTAGAGRISRRNQQIPCPLCGALARCIESRPEGKSEHWRRRECIKCSHRFDTIERRIDAVPKLSRRELRRELEIAKLRARLAKLSA